MLFGYCEDILWVVNIYDIVVVLLIWDEFFGWVVLEVMVVGKLVIVLCVGGIFEIIEYDCLGVLMVLCLVGELIVVIY